MSHADVSGIDLVRDHPEEAMLREVDTIKDCQARMKNLLDRVNLQVGVWPNGCSKVMADLSTDEDIVGL